LALNGTLTTIYAADYSAKNVKVLSYPVGNLIATLGSANGITDPYGVALGPPNARLVAEAGMLAIEQPHQRRPGKFFNHR
jgi:hypothetical protein